MACAAHRAGQEIEILENEQKRYVAKEAYPQVEAAAPLLLRLFYLQAGHIVDHRDGPDHEDVAGPPAHIEVVAGGQQNDLAGSPPRNQNQQPHHDKKEQKLKAIEEHGVCPSAAETKPLYRSARRFYSGASDRQTAGWDRDSSQDRAACKRWPAPAARQSRRHTLPQPRLPHCAGKRAHSSNPWDIAGSVDSIDWPAYSAQAPRAGASAWAGPRRDGSHRAGGRRESGSAR